MQRALVGCAIVLALWAAQAQAKASVPLDGLNESFENAGAIPADWVSTNNSNPADSTWLMKQNYPGRSSGVNVLPRTGSYFAGCGDFSVGDAQGVADDWLMTPVLAVHAGDQLSFYAMSRPGNGDSLYVSYSNAEYSTNVGSTAPAFGSIVDDASFAAAKANVGDFSNAILAINPINNFNDAVNNPSGIPGAWTQYTYTFTEDFTGRIGFRYFLYDAGGWGTYSYAMGIDDVQVGPVPEPASLALLCVGGLALLRRRSGR